MDEEKRFLILSLEGESYAIPITRLVEISAPRQIRNDASSALLIISTVKGVLGILVDAVSEIINAEQKPVPLPPGVINPGIRYYGGVLRHGDSLVLLLNADGLMP